MHRFPLRFRENKRGWGNGDIPCNIKHTPVDQGAQRREPGLLRKYEEEEEKGKDPFQFDKELHG
jgi:hypothetical protein